jgi:hypothetical protein
MDGFFHHLRRTELSRFLSPHDPANLLVQQSLPEANRIIILAQSTAS